MIRCNHITQRVEAFLGHVNSWEGEAPLSREVGTRNDLTARQEPRPPEELRFLRNNAFARAKAHATRTSAGHDLTTLPITGMFVLSCLLLIGCAKSSPAPSGGTTASTTSETSPSESGTKTVASKSTGEPKAKTDYWEDYPDVPKIEIMTEVDGIKIPRVPASKETLQLTGPIEVDVGNEHAKQKPSEPVTGDTLTIRFNAEPKVLNPITENSAYKTYIMQYVNESLAKQNLETFAFEPKIAKKWIVEDSVKLSANFPGRERRLVKNDDAATSATKISDSKPESKPVSFKTTDKDGTPVGHTWVAFFPKGDVPGAPKTGYHFWSDDQGLLEVSGVPIDQCEVKVGDEVFGQIKREEDGSLVVTAATDENPLREPLTLKAGEWQDIQAQTYTTFYLRDDVKWSDGVLFTTKDIEFGYALLNSPYVDGDSIRTYYSDLVECTALGKYTIRLRYRQQYFKAPEFSYTISDFTPPWHFFEDIFRAQGRELTLEALSAEDEAAKKKISARGKEFGKFFNTDERYNSKPLGTGPYIVDRWERTDRVELVRNPNYWDVSKAGYLDRIIVKFIPDQVTAFTALKAGELDFIYRLSAEQFFEDWPSLDQETKDKFVKASWFSPAFQYIGWNQLAVPLKDRRVRLALSMLFDRQDFINKKLRGSAVIVSGANYVFGPGYDRDVLPIAYDPNTARELLTEAGWIDTDNDGILDRNGEKFHVLMRIPNGNPIANQICEILQKNCKDVGIDLQIQTMEWASFIDKIHAKECDVIMLAWAMAPENDPYQIWHSSGAAREKRGSNSISFSNRQADELIEMLRVTLDPEKRRRIDYSFHRLLDSEQPYTFMWTPKDFGAYHKRFRNVKWYRLRPGFDLSEWYVPKDEQLHK